MENAKKLIRDIEKKKEKWDEMSMFKIKGVKNLSVSDLDTIVLYAETYIKNGSFRGLMRPVGGVLEVLDAYELKEPERGLFGF